MTVTPPARPRLFGIYALVTPGARAADHTLVLELRASTLVRMAVGSDDEGVEAIRSYVDRHTVHLVELGGGWSNVGIGRLVAAVGDRTIVTTRWFPTGELPDRSEGGKVRRGVLFFCSTPNTRAYLETPRDRIWFEGVLNVDAAIEACARLAVDPGVQVLELCSDWGFVGGARAQQAVGPHVKVGISLHQASDADRRARQLYVPTRFATEQPSPAPVGER